MVPVKPTLSTRIQEATGLSPAQRRISECLLTHAAEAALWGVEDLAVESGASVATIVRYAKRLGYAGYLEMRKAMVQTAKSNYRRGDQLLEAPTQAGATLAEVAHRDIANIQQVMKTVQEKTLREAVRMIKESRIRLVIGDGVSALMARHMAYLLINTGLSVMEGSPADFASQVGNLTPADLLVAISITPYTRETLDAAAYARKLGVPVLAFTDSLHSPMVRHATLVLPIPGRNLLFSHSMAAFGVLIHALATFIAREDPKGVLRKLHEVEKVSGPKFTRE
jgi:DNA-binding MurR/RpiR family transcriptional regulator